MSLLMYNWSNKWYAMFNSTVYNAETVYKHLKIVLLRRGDETSTHRPSLVALSVEYNQVIRFVLHGENPESTAQQIFCLNFNHSDVFTSIGNEESWNDMKVLFFLQVNIIDHRCQIDTVDSFLSRKKCFSLSNANDRKWDSFLFCYLLLQYVSFCVKNTITIHFKLCLSSSKDSKILLMEYMDFGSFEHEVSITAAYGMNTSRTFD